MPPLGERGHASSRNEALEGVVALMHRQHLAWERLAPVGAPPDHSLKGGMLLPQSALYRRRPTEVPREAGGGETTTITAASRRD